MGLRVRFLRSLSIASMVLCGVLVAAPVVGVPTGSAAYAQSASSIVVEGNRRVEAETIRSYFHGGRLDAMSIDEGVKALYATGLFQDVRVRNAGGRVIVTVVENQVINRVAFEGNKKTKDDQLNAEVQSKPRGTLSRATVQADTQRIIEIYRRNGRFDVRVEPKVIELPNNRVDLVFEISEGEKTGVKDIEFVGNKAFSGSRLKDVIKTTESNWLSFLQTTDIYDQDRIESDRDLLRRFYLKRGYADVRITSAVGQYDPAKKGFIVTFSIDEGPLYHFGKVDVVSNVRSIDPNLLRSRMVASSGSVYNAEAIEKSVEGMTIEAAKRGYAFATVHPNGDRDFAQRKINVVFVVEEGARAYIERINIRGNTRTRDYVIRREFDIGEGDAYNRALIDRAERRLKNLDYFKTVKITNEPGSAPDRIVVNVDVEEKATGEFSISGGYSTADGVLAEVAVAERNLLGRGQYARASVSYGQYSRGIELSFAEPFFLGYRLGFGTDLFYKRTLATSYVSYNTETAGVNLRLGVALTEELSVQLRYSLFRRQISLPDYYDDCKLPNTVTGPGSPCYLNGEASLPVRADLARGSALTSALGYTVAYNTLDNNRNPTNGLLIEGKQDFAGVGGDVNFIKTTGDIRNYYEVFPDIVSLIHVQAGHMASWGGKDLRMLDHFQLGPTLVRGFEPAGIGPRDITPGTTNDALGGTMYWGASLELQTPLYFLPKEVGIKAAVFADAGSLWGYRGPTTYSLSPNEAFLFDDSNKIRSSVGGSLIWDSPFGPLRFDVAYALTKGKYDRTQIFRFGGGTKF